MIKLIPTNDKFFDYFERISDVLVRASEHFSHSLDNDAQKLAETITTFEHQGDEITHETMDLMHASFITPLERPDIRRLILSLDNVLDSLDDAARRIALYKVGPVLPDVKSLAAVLVKATTSMRLAVHELRNMRKSKSISEHCIEVHHCEDEGDRIYHHALATLFQSSTDVMAAVKWKDIIEDMEKAIDDCQEVSEVIQGIVIENS